VDLVWLVIWRIWRAATTAPTVRQFLDLSLLLPSEFVPTSTQKKLRQAPAALDGVVLLG
jgi:hypothetical protein